MVLYSYLVYSYRGINYGVSGKIDCSFYGCNTDYYISLQYIAQLNSENIDILVDDRTHQFTENIRGKGYLDCQMYEEYIAYLAATGEKYEIDIQDIRPVWEKSR